MGGPEHLVALSVEKVLDKILHVTINFVSLYLIALSLSDHGDELAVILLSQLSLELLEVLHVGLEMPRLEGVDLFPVLGIVSGVLELVRLEAMSFEVFSFCFFFDFIILISHGLVGAIDPELVPLTDGRVDPLQEVV